jgi:protein-disulfide isomerase
MMASEIPGMVPEKCEWFRARHRAKRRVMSAPQKSIAQLAGSIRLACSRRCSSVPAIVMAQTGEKMRTFVRWAVFAALVASAAVFIHLSLNWARADRQARAKNMYEQVTRAYLLSHPEIFEEARAELGRRAERQRLAQHRTEIRANRKGLLEDPMSPVLGDEQANVTIVEFLDYGCPYCREMDPLLVALMRRDPSVRIVHKQFPLLGPMSVFAARVALTAWKFGKHTEFHNAMMAWKEPLTEQAIVEVARAVGIDILALSQSVGSKEITSALLNDISFAKTFELTSTPGFIVGDELVPGATDAQTLVELVADARASTN